VELKKFEMPSRAVLEINPAPFVDAMGLNKAIIRCKKGLPVLPGISEIVQSEILASDDVEAALFKCAERAIYAGARVTRDLFDDEKLGPQARKDYYAIVSRIIEVNVSPFFEVASSKLKASQKTPTDTQK
jgi:hypothetical protein